MKTPNKPSKLVHLGTMLKQSSIVHKIVGDASDNTQMMLMPIKEAEDELLPIDHSMYNMLYIVHDDKDDTWSIGYEAVVRLIDESNPRRNKANTEILLNAGAEIYNANIPALDHGGNVPIRWSTDLDADPFIIQPLEGRKSGVILGTSVFKASTKDVFDLIATLENIPAIDFVEQEADGSDFIQPESNTIQ